MYAGLACRLLIVGPRSEETATQLGKAKAILAAGGYDVEADIAQGQPETVISDAVESEAIDLLVMGAYGHSRIRNLIIGSTTTEMVRLCKIPVVLYR